MCPNCGDAMYPNGYAQVMGDDFWHCYSEPCGTSVAYNTNPFKRNKILRINKCPDKNWTLDKQLEEMALLILKDDQEYQLLINNGNKA